jgi:hypothetical protein
MPERPLYLTFGMAVRLRAAKRRAEERERIIADVAARGVWEIEQYLKGYAR